MDSWSWLSVGGQRGGQRGSVSFAAGEPAKAAPRRESAETPMRALHEIAPVCACEREIERGRYSQFSPEEREMRRNARERKQKLKLRGNSFTFNFPLAENIARRVPSAMSFRNGAESVNFLHVLGWRARIRC